MLQGGSANHLSTVGKQNVRRKVNLEKLVAGIMNVMEPGESPFPVSLPGEDEAHFGLGYYHQRNEFFRKTPDATETGETAQ